jgi:YfiR/HmsC-like
MWRVAYRPIETKAKDHELFAHYGFLVRPDSSAVGDARAAGRRSDLLVDLDAMTTTPSFQQERNRKLQNHYFAWRSVGILIALACLCLAAPVRTKAQESLPEYQVKAAYLFNFLKFVEYPEDAFADPLAPIVIGVVGEDPFGAALAQVVTGKTVQGRDLVIRKYRTGEDLRGAHILFISPSEKKRLPTILSSLRDSSVLTVADTEGFLEAGGMIQFLYENNRVRFAINVDATSRAKLKMSSKLLSLARVVGGNVKEPGK